MLPKTRLVLVDGTTLIVHILYTLHATFVIWNSADKKFQVVKKDWVKSKVVVSK